ncbi:YvrJ family protein [Peribacillus sp. JNUCC 23]|uniref:YvrJ family protein n=1 Tax=Peribacillus sp. NPDC096379 TaxID=3364393 RepID=UPI000784376E
MNELLTFVSDVGFPIIVTLYLLHRFEAKLDVLNQTIVELPDRLKDHFNLKNRKDC